MFTGKKISNTSCSQSIQVKAHKTSNMNTKITEQMIGKNRRGCNINRMSGQNQQNQQQNKGKQKLVSGKDQISESHSRMEKKSQKLHSKSELNQKKKQIRGKKQQKKSIQVMEEQEKKISHPTQQLELSGEHHFLQYEESQLKQRPVPEPFSQNVDSNELEKQVSIKHKQYDAFNMDVFSMDVEQILAKQYFVV